MKKIYLVEKTNPKGHSIGGTAINSINFYKYLVKNDFDVIFMGNGIDTVNKHFLSVCKENETSTYRFVLNLFKKYYKIKNSIIVSYYSPFQLPFIFNRNNHIVDILSGQVFKQKKSKKGLFFNLIYYLLEKLVLKRTNTIIAVDELTKIEYEKRYHFLKNKINVIPSGVDINRFKPLNKSLIRKKYGYTNEENILLYVGRFSKEKNLVLLLSNLKIWTQEIPNFKLILTGYGPEEPKLVSTIRKLNITNVEMIGGLTHSKVPEIMNCANALILFSDYEGMPTVVLESLACGVPTLCTNVGDIKKIITNDETGYIVSEKNIEEKIQLIFKNSAKMKNNCIKKAQDYSWEKIGEKSLAHIQKSINN